MCVVSGGGRKVLLYAEGRSDIVSPSTAETAAEGAWVLPGPSVLVPGARGGGGAPLRKSGTLTALRRGSGTAFCSTPPRTPGLSRVRGSAVACSGAMATVSLTCWVLAAGPKLCAVCVTAPQNLRLYTQLNVVQGFKGLEGL